MRAIRIQRHRQHWGQSEYRDTGNIGNNQNTETHATLGQSEYRDTGNIEDNLNTETQETLGTIRIQRHS